VLGLFFETTLVRVQRWPLQEIPNFKSVTVDCFESCARLTRRVLLAIATGLNMKVYARQPLFLQATYYEQECD